MGYTIFVDLCYIANSTYLRAESGKQGSAAAGGGDEEKQTIPNVHNNTFEKQPTIGKYLCTSQMAVLRIDCIR